MRRLDVAMMMRHSMWQHLSPVAIISSCSILIIAEIASAKGPPQIVAAYQQRHLIRSGESLRLTCPVDSVPPPLITWQKDGETIHLGWDRFRTNEDARVLRIKELEPMDSGILICRATNGFGTVDVKYLIYVYDSNDTVIPSENFDEDIFETLPGREDPPQFLHPDQMEPHVAQHTGSTVRLTCKASGKPKPEVTWYKNGVALQTTEVNNDIMDKWMLKIVDVQETDNGRYLCKVANKAGAINFTYNVHVTDKTGGGIAAGGGGGDNGDGLLIALHPDNMTAPLGSTATFVCQVQTDNLPPRVQWLKRLDGEDMRIRHYSYNNTVTLNGQPYAVLNGDAVVSRKDGTFLNRLTISSVTTRDAGMYICSSTSSTHGFNFRSAFLSILPSDLNGASHEKETGSLLDAAFVPVIIAIIIVVSIVFSAVVLFVVCRRRICADKSSSSDATVGGGSSENPTQRLTGATATMTAAQGGLGGGVGGGGPPLQIPFEHHQYAALRSNPQGFPLQQSLMAAAPSRERIVRSHPDNYSDYSSIAKPPVLQMSGNKQLLLQQHHYQQQQQQQQQQLQQHPQLQFYENC